MFYSERFYDLGTTYVIVAAREFRLAPQPADAGLELVTRHETRWIIEKIAQRDRGLLGRLYEALTGVRRPAAGAFSLRAVPNPEALTSLLFEAFGVDRFTDDTRMVPHFYLLRANRSGPPRTGQTESPESRRIGQALAKLGKGPITYRGASYYLQQAGRPNELPINRDAYEAMSEAILFDVLRELTNDSSLGSDRKTAAQQLLSAVEDQCAKKGSTELVLLRRQRFFARPESSSPAITPSQMKRAREQERTSEWQISLVSSDGLPIPEAGYIITFADGTNQSGKLDRDGKAKVTGPKGPYTIQYVNHADLRAKALAARANKAINGSDAAVLLGVLSQPANELGLVRDHYATYFGGDLASAARSALGGDENTALGDHLLAAANLAPDATKAVYAYADPSRRPDQLANADKGTAIA